jgi:hypothetical protein
VHIDVVVVFCDEASSLICRVVIQRVRGWSSFGKLIVGEPTCLVVLLLKYIVVCKAASPPWTQLL